MRELSESAKTAHWKNPLGSMDVQRGRVSKGKAGDIPARVVLRRTRLNCLTLIMRTVRAFLRQVGNNDPRNACSLKASGGWLETSRSSALQFGSWVGHAHEVLDRRPPSAGPPNPGSRMQSVPGFPQRTTSKPISGIRQQLSLRRVQILATHDS